MRIRRSTRTAVAFVAAGALVLAACGEDDDTGAEPDTEEENGEAADVDGEPWELVESSTSAMLAELGSAVDAEEPIVVTLWRPHWAYDAWDLKDLEDPENALGDAEEIHAIGRDGFADDFPEAAEWLGNFELDADQVAELSTLVLGVEDDRLESPHDSEVEAARAWMEDNQDLVDEWLGDDAGNEVGGGESIEIAFIPWDEAIAVTNLWEVILEDHGYDVTQTQADVAPTFDGVAGGQYDLFLDMWLPATHEDYLEEYGEDIEQLGVWFDDARLTWTVPAYVDEVDSIADLPEHHDMFGGQIIGIESGAGLTRISNEEVIPTYGLD
jgi:glycine betaine/proline transport system substrate-binding protein